ncbi:glycosyl hydrolase family 43 protein [Phlyctema vagabunda]|uniref:Glycosyl hydrolase family 43 protein n=1 Tax=Phlyctema vagabunda TaxID=108571 RepID=A0ABR4P2G2_9HELO
MYLSNLLLLGGALQAGISSASYQNPIRNPGPDPSIVYADGMYYLTHTDYDFIGITRSRTLGGLATGEKKTIWTDSNTTRNANMWAPEIHQIDNVWHMFYSACDSTLPCCDSCKTRVLQGCDASNPYDCEYSFLATLVPPPGAQGGNDKNFPFSIDGTYLEIPEKGRYHVLSTADPSGLQAITITELDTTTWTVKGWNVISIPDQPWEMNTTNANPDPIVAVNEAPHPLYHGGEIWLSYSGSFCGTPNYAIGLLRYNGGDPLLGSSWEKTGPVFSQANGNYGTGHNCFFTSPDGTEIWNGFHATSNVNGSCGTDRYTMAQVVNFDRDNVPSFGVPYPLDAMLVSPSGEASNVTRRFR